MRIESLRIEGFGHFANCDLGPFDTGLSVVHGHNEAGKTTLLAFVRTVLFGFPAQKRADFYPALNGGRHGGRIVLVDDVGDRYTVERLEDTRGQVLRILLPSGAQTSEEAVLVRLLGSASRALFEAVFAFGLLDLQKMEAIEKGEASRQIYAAGLGAANLPAARTSLAAEAEDLYLPRGSRQEVAKLLRELETTDAQLAEVRGQASEYAGCTEELATLETGRAETATKLESIAQELRELERLGAAWDDWVLRSDLESQLRGMPEQHAFPPDGLRRVDDLEHRYAETDASCEDIRGELRSLNAKANLPVPDQPLLEESTEVEEMRRQNARLVSAINDLPRRSAELKSLRREIDDALRQLGPGWDRERLAAFDLSAGTREMIDRSAAAIAHSEATTRDADQRAESVAAQLRDATERAEKAAGDLDRQPVAELSDEEISARLGQLRLARSTVSELGLARNRRELLEGQSHLLAAVPLTGAQASLPVVPLVLAVAALLLLMIGVLSRGTGLIVAIVGAGGVLAAAGVVHLRSRSRPRPGKSQGRPVVLPGLDAARRDEEALRLRVEELATTVGAARADFAALDAVEGTLARFASQLSSRRAAEATLEDTVAERHRLASRHRAALEEASAARLAHESAKDAWKQWLVSRGLAESLSPATAIAVLGDIRTLRARLSAAGDLEERIAKIQVDIDREGARVVRLAACLGIQFDAADSQRLLRQCDDLLARYDAASAAARERVHDKGRAEEARQRLENQERRLSTLRRAMEELVASAGARDLANFRELGQIDAERRQLMETLRECDGRLRVISGPGEAFERLLSTLAVTDRLSIDSGLEELRAQRREASETAQETSQKIGSTKSRLEQLRTDEHAGLLRAKRANLIEQLQREASTWSKLVIARRLLELARAKFERERQPDVVRHAQGYFQTITGGRYDRIVAPVGEQRITVLPSDGGGARLPAQLSQGTQEQLYLAMRFGLIEQFARQGTALPVILDEILVNFDPERAREAARTLRQLSEGHQVLFFTCHPWVVDLFRSVDGPAALLDLDALRPTAQHALGA